MIEFRHAGLVVDNIERELEFFQKYFKLEAISNVIEDEHFISTILNIDRKLSVRTIKLGKNNLVILELLHFPSKSIIDPYYLPKVTMLGYTHIALTVSNVKRLYDRMLKDQIVCLGEPKISVNGKAKLFFCRDYEGNLIELVQELTVK